MDIKPAVDVACGYVGEEYPYSAIQLAEGRVRALNSIRGCDLTCADATVACSVAADQLRGAVRALQSDMQMSIGKGRKLHVEGSGSIYKIKALPQSAEFVFPQAPDWPNGWSVIPGDVVKAISSMAKIAPEEGSLAGVYFGPSYVVSADLSHCCILWQGVSPQPVLVPPKFLVGLSETVSITVVEGKVWLRTEDGSLRWTRLLAQEYPAAAIMGLVERLRSLPGRHQVSVPMSEVAALAKRATAIAEGRVDAYRVTVHADELHMRGGDAGSSWGATEFAGVIDVQPNADGSGEAAVTGDSLHKIASLIASLGGENHVLSLSDRTTPLSIHGGAPVLVEGILQPVHI